MNETEHLLTIVAEECCEIAQVACKANRFGLSHVGGVGAETNTRKIERELAQLIAVAELLGFKIREEDKAAKREKLKEFMTYARGLGTLNGPEGQVCPECGRSLPGNWVIPFAQMDPRKSKGRCQTCLDKRIGPQGEPLPPLE